MRHEMIEIRIAALPVRVWDVLKDVQRWHEWTPSIRAVVPLGPPHLGLGHRFSISQPRLKSMVWTVTRLQPGASFAWQASAPGLALTARHDVEIEGSGSRVRLSLEFAGLFGGAVARLLRSTHRRYLRMEAEGLKARCERDSDDPQRSSAVTAAHGHARRCERDR